jgi:hypothetical protein
MFGENKKMDKKKFRVGALQSGGSFDTVMAAGLAALSLAAAFAVHVAPPIIHHPHASKKGPPLAMLPIAITPGQTHRQIAKMMVKKDAFIALALGVESSPAKAYVDAAGANAGAGYCVEMRRRALGEAQVRDELARAGFFDDDINNLLSRDGGRIESVKVGQAQSLRLLVISKPQYEEMARKAVGSKVFDALPSNKKDVLSYLAYNTGGPQKFVKLIHAVRAGDDVAALSQLAPTVKVAHGKKLKNHRLRAWAQAAWMGPEQLKKALDTPVAFELAYAGQKGQEKFIQAHAAFLTENSRRFESPRSVQDSAMGRNLAARRKLAQEVKDRLNIKSARLANGSLKTHKA